MKVIIDPREARRFASYLDENARDLGELTRRVSLHVTEMSMSTWQDRRYDEFLREFEEASTLLMVFLEHAEKYADYLRRKAAPIERYLGLS